MELLTIATIVITVPTVAVVVTVPEARSNRQGLPSAASVHNSTWTNGRGWRDPSSSSTSSWVHDRGWVDSRHPDANFVLLEQVGDHIIEVDVRIGIIEEGKLMVIAACVSLIEQNRVK